VEAGIPTEALLAHIAVAKYADEWPLYRQEAIFAREQIELGRNLMAGWMGRIGFHLEPLADRILHHIRAGERIFAGETTLAPGTGKAKIAWLLAYAREDRPFGRAGLPMVAHRFEDSRGGDCPAQHLAGFLGAAAERRPCCLQAPRRSPPHRWPNDAGGLLGVSQAVLLRTPHRPPVRHRHLDGRAHGHAMGH
jgi:hypothetical protein